jgi:export-related chaperone CsaA
MHVSHDPTSPPAAPISFDQFLAVDIRVGRIVSAEDFPEARKPAFKLTIDFGPAIGIRKSSAQITEHYTRDTLVGRMVAAVVNCSMTPTIVTKDNKLVMVVGTPGGSRIPSAVLEVIMNVIDYKMTLQEAVDAPRIHQQWMPDVTYYEHDALSADTMKLLAEKGQALEEVGYGNQIAAILVGAPALGRPPLGKNTLYGSIDPRLNLGTVDGY